MADQAPQQATLLNGMGKLQKNGSTICMVLWKRSRVLPSGIPDPEFRVRNSGAN